MKAPGMIAADVPGHGCMYYLVDEALNFVPEVKDFLDWGRIQVCSSGMVLPLPLTPAVGSARGYSV
jgi:hypothetical protein